MLLELADEKENQALNMNRVEDKGDDGKHSDREHRKHSPAKQGKS